MRLPCSHTNELHWVHYYCHVGGPQGHDDSGFLDSEDSEDMDSDSDDGSSIPQLSVGELARVKQGLKPSTQLIVQVSVQFGKLGNKRSLYRAIEHKSLLDIIYSV